MMSFDEHTTSNYKAAGVLIAVVMITSCCTSLHVVGVPYHTSNVEDVLSPDYYMRSCPAVESIVRSSMVQSTRKSSIALQAVVRLFFHDCFVEGCDASILIGAGRPGEPARERDAEPNRSLAGDGFDAIKDAKALVERVCPGIVSCADILAIAARDAVTLANGPTWIVRKGRKDGRISLASRVQGNLPEANFNVDELRASFKSKGLGIIDMVALSGAHTLGFAHCHFFANRLYQYNVTHPIDPSMDIHYVTTLQRICPAHAGSENTVQPLDLNTPFTFDHNFFKNLQVGKGLLASDQALWIDPQTREIVNIFARNESAFFSTFASAMIKLGEIGAKIGNQGDIRKDCSMFNL